MVRQRSDRPLIRVNDAVDALRLTAACALREE